MSEMVTVQDSDLFPAFSRWVRESGFIDKGKGNLAAKLPRILGQGTTRAKGLNLPPAAVERKSELASLRFPVDFPAPEEVLREQSEASKELENLKTEMMRDEGKRKLAVQALEHLPEPRGFKDGRFHAGGMILQPSKSGLEWAWSITPHYSIIGKIPPDPEYIVTAYHAAKSEIKDLTLEPKEFQKRLELAWFIARHFSDTDNVFITDVMKMFNVAGQNDRFWQIPQKQSFKDLPEAAFVINLIHWRSHADPQASTFDLVPATLNQTRGRDAKVFYLPMNLEGTDVRPMVYMRRRS
jgi:hypothetical protein